MLLAVLLFLGVVVRACMSLYYEHFEPSWLIYPELPLPVITPVVKPGQTVVLRVRRISTQTVKRTYDVAHTLVCRQHLPAAMKSKPPVSVDPGDTTIDSKINDIPDDTEPDTCYVDGLSEIQGTIRTILVPWRSADFQVVR